MNWALWKKNLSQSWLLLAACAAALSAFCWVRVWLVGQIEMTRFQRIVESLPESFQRLSPVPLEQLFSYAGRIALVYEEPMVYLVMAVWAIARASDSISGEVGRGTMEMLLAQPIGRLQILLHHAMATIAGVLVLAGVAYLATWVGLATTEVTVRPPPRSVGIPLWRLPIPVPLPPGEPQRVPLRELVDPAVFWPATVNFASLGIFLTGLTTFLSSWDSYRWRTIGLAVGFFVVETLVELLAVALERSGLRKLTFLAAYEPVQFVTSALDEPKRAWQVFWSGDPLTLGPIGCDLVLVGLGLVGLLAAAVIFHRRDLSAPV